MKKLIIPTAICALCHKGSVVGTNKPHSLHKTTRVVNPNLQTYTDPNTKVRIRMCTRCMRTLSHKS
ncbi:50S ribosomal protein L28 [Candidatus Berkelbacteria bacterium CG06_land_8_20_14_3_00_43_10]|uniref:50S ribosomal protein L28 n=1 Tax=Candidatus Berkelbacteria bacterium CG10_big_fil_rev_8_21_14_0_10_43_14 TaxID=1974515 RepID=A0A2M6R9B5_9BACT|nr:MAG: 50S ribosomal protein L28 [Candidatus Berkelbacteria bacterium CG10_big_fil_rev_8_21_14_0_10_43_14]PIU87430.1 MAG: 50S ribosomal protein L28 [Candidatus Berkelbacteria bacterium CG06_land_8_20_14_3_00_43_10]